MLGYCRTDYPARGLRVSQGTQAHCRGFQLGEDRSRRREVAVLSGTGDSEVQRGAPEGN